MGKCLVSCFLRHSVQLCAGCVRGGYANSAHTVSYVISPASQPVSVCVYVCVNVSVTSKLHLTLLLLPLKAKAAFTLRAELF